MGTPSSPRTCNRSINLVHLNPRPSFVMPVHGRTGTGIARSFKYWRRYSHGLCAFFATL